MSIIFTIPDLGDSTTIGTVLSIFVAPGSKVAAGENLLEIETDKVVMEVPAEQDGIVEDFLVNVGDKVEMGTEFVSMIQQININAADEVEANNDIPKAAHTLDNSGEKETLVEQSTEKVNSTLTSKTNMTLTIPELGDSTTTGTVLSILVNAGSKVAAGDNLLEVETDKVVMEIPAEQEGIIDNFLVNVGDKVEMGTEFVSITQETETKSQMPEQKGAQISTNSAEKEELVNQKIEKSTLTCSKAVKENSDMKMVATQLLCAGPSVRRLARQLGLDLSQITGSGIRQRISKSDVKAYVKSKLQNDSSHGNQASSNLQQKTLPDFTSYGEITRLATTGIQKVTAQNMQHSCQRIPHAWVQQEIDITDLEQARKRHKNQVKTEGGSLTLTAIMTKLLAKLINEFPIFSAAYDEVNNEFVYRNYRNIGVAIDTPRGLVVAAIKDVGNKSVIDVAKDLAITSAKAREGKLRVEDMQGSVMTISNLGGLGATGIMPVVNWPEAAILGVTAAQWLPRLRTQDSESIEQGHFVPRLIMNVSLGFDHRIINGADAARFLSRLKGYCEDPTLLAFNL